MTHPTGKRADQIATLLAELTRRGAPPDCRVMSKSSIHDSKVMMLTEALQALSDNGCALVICLPGQLAVHLPEAPTTPVIRRPMLTPLTSAADGSRILAAAGLLSMAVKELLCKFS